MRELLHPNRVTDPRLTFQGFITHRVRKAWQGAPAKPAKPCAAALSTEYLDKVSAELSPKMNVPADSFSRNVVAIDELTHKYSCC